VIDMALLSRTALKALWVKFYKPTQNNYDDVWDSFYNKTDDEIGTADLADNSVTNAKLAQIAQNIIKGRVTAGTGNVEDLTASQVQTMLSVAYQAMAAAFAFGGQATGGAKIKSFSSTPTFDLNDGNSQEMTLTNDLTSLTLSYKVNGGSYLIYLIQDVIGSRTIPTPDSTWGNKIDDSANFVTSANAVNLINVNVRPNGTTYYTIATYTP